MMRIILPKILAAVLVVVMAAGCSAEAKKSRLLARAEKYFQAGEYDKAKIEYLNLLRADPKNELAVDRLGIIWFEQGAPLQALPFLLNARDRSPDQLKIRGRVAVCLMSIGEIAAARKEALAILEKAPADEEAVLLLATTALTPEDIDQAEQHLQKLGESDKAYVKLALATLLLRKGEAEAGKAAVQQALALDPKSSAAHLTLANICWLQQDLVKAGEEFKAAAELAPIRSSARLRHAEFKGKTGAAEEATALLKEILRQAPDYLPAWDLLAQIAVAEKKYDEALATLENVFGRDPGNYNSRMLEAQIFMAKGEAGKAVESLERLEKLYPKVPLIKFQVARAYLQKKDQPQAVLALDRAIALNPTFAEALLLQAEVNLRAGNAQVVISSMQDLLKRRPGLLQAELFLADAYRASGRLDDAAAIFRKQITVAPTNAQPYLMLGVVLRQQGKSAEARQVLEKAREFAPDNMIILAQLVDQDLRDKRFTEAAQRVQKQLEKTPSSPSAHFLEGRIHAAQREWDRAEASLLKTIELEPNFSSAYDLLISTYMAANKLSQAGAQLEGLLSRNPDNVRARMLAATIYTSMKDYTKAKDGFEKVLAISPNAAAALNNLAYLYDEHLGDPEKAYDLARKARAAQADDASIADTLGWILYKRGDYQQALALLQESAQKIPTNPEVQFHLGMAGYMMGQTDVALNAFRLAADSPGDFPGKDEVRRRLALLGEASAGASLSVDELQALLKQHPNDLVALSRLGETYEKQGAFGKAAAVFEQALKMNPKLVMATKKLAQLYAGPLKDRDKALGYAKKARDLSPNDAEAVGILGGIVYQTGDVAWAYSLLQESARQLSDNSVVLFDLAWAAYSLGKVDEARKTMQRVLEADPGSRQAVEARSFLAMTALSSPEEFVAAEPQMRKLLEADATYVPALMARATLDVQRGNSKAAADTCMEILRRTPDFTPAQKQLALLYLDDPDQKAKAYDLAVKARNALPEDPELARALGELSYDRKEFAYAIQLFQESARTKPLTAKNLFHLGMSEWQTKQKAKSQETLQRAVAAGLQEPLLTQAKRTLAELEKK